MAVGMNLPPVRRGEIPYPDNFITFCYILPLPPPATWGTGPAPTVSLSISPTTIRHGQSATLMWSTSNTRTCPLNTNASTGSTDVPPSGSLTITPGKIGNDYFTYTLGCTNNGLDAIASQSVSVMPR